MADPKIVTTHLGPHVSEGTRALWKALGRLFGGSQAELARALGTSSGLVNKWLHGLQTPGLRWAHRIHGVAGVDPVLWTKPLASPLKLKRSAA